jgi:hypothetical protein
MVYLFNAVGLTPGGSSTLHTHTNSTQNNTLKQNTQNITYIKTRIYKRNKNTCYTIKQKHTKHTTVHKITKNITIYKITKHITIYKITKHTTIYKITKHTTIYKITNIQPYIK